MNDVQEKKELRRRAVVEIVQTHPTYSLKLIIADLFQKYGILASRPTIYEDLSALGFVNGWYRPNNVKGESSEA